VKLMNAVMWTGPERMEWVEMPVPEVGPDELLIQVKTVGICGSDLEGYLGHNSLRKPPLLMGHEFSGIVMQKGDAVTSFSIDDRVVINPLTSCGTCEQCLRGTPQLCAQRQIIGIHHPGGYAEYVVVKQGNAYRIPEHLSFERASLTEPLACALRAVKRAFEPHTIPHVTVIGAGGIGLLCAFVANILGASKVSILDKNPERLQIAQSVGIDAYREGKVDVVIDAAGFQPTRTAGFEMLNPGGVLMNIGLGIDDTLLPINQSIRSEIDIRGSFCYSPLDFTQALSLLSEGRITEDVWTLHRPLSEGARSFKQLTAGEIAHGKILLFTEDK